MIRPQRVVLDEDTEVTITLVGDGSEHDPTTFTVIEGPSHGVLDGTAPSVVYRPFPDFAGSDAFVYVVDYARGRAFEARVSITVNAINDPPRTRAQTLETDEDTEIQFVIDAWNPDGDALTWWITRWMPGGNLIGSPPDLLFVPTRDFNGTLVVEYQVEDQSDVAVPGRIEINVRPVDDPPQHGARSERTTEDVATWCACLVEVRSVHRLDDEPPYPTDGLRPEAFTLRGLHRTAIEVLAAPGEAPVAVGWYAIDDEGQIGTPNLLWPSVDRAAPEVDRDDGTTEEVAATVLHAWSAALNADGQPHVMTGRDSDRAHALRIAFVTEAGQVILRLTLHPGDIEGQHLPATRLFGGNIEITDVDDTRLSRVDITLVDGARHDDTLALRDSTPQIEVEIADDPPRIVMRGDADIATYSGLLRDLSIHNLDALDELAGPRHFAIEARDARGADSAPVTVEIDVR